MRLRLKCRLFDTRVGRAFGPAVGEYEAKMALLQCYGALRFFGRSDCYSDVGGCSRAKQSQDQFQRIHERVSPSRTTPFRMSFHNERSVKVETCADGPCISSLVESGWRTLWWGIFTLGIFSLSFTVRARGRPKGRAGFAMRIRLTHDRFEKISPM